MALPPTTCPSCRHEVTPRDHCANRPPCGWIRCGSHACSAVWRARDRHVMAPHGKAADHG